MAQGTEFLQTMLGDTGKMEAKQKNFPQCISVMRLQKNIQNLLKYNLSHQSISREHKQFNRMVIGFSYLCLKAHF